METPDPTPTKVRADANMMVKEDSSQPLSAPVTRQTTNKYTKAPTQEIDKPDIKIVRGLFLQEVGSHFKITQVGSIPRQTPSMNRLMSNPEKLPFLPSNFDSASASTINMVWRTNDKNVSQHITRPVVSALFSEVAQVYKEMAAMHPRHAATHINPPSQEQVFALWCQTVFQTSSVREDAVPTT
mmetsp:Transcript_8034/g.22190  ORF Transcript_8034/g.22190 Transcript_8034/m.22190 type:complete len:184 (+) Transcript_8034:309-860(+)